MDPNADSSDAPVSLGFGRLDAGARRRDVLAACCVRQAPQRLPFGLSLSFDKPQGDRKYRLGHPSLTIGAGVGDICGATKREDAGLVVGGFMRTNSGRPYRHDHRSCGGVEERPHKGESKGGISGDDPQ